MFSKLGLFLHLLWEQQKHFAERRKLCLFLLLSIVHNRKCRSNSIEWNVKPHARRRRKKLKGRDAREKIIDCFTTVNKSTQNHLMEGKSTSLHVMTMYGGFLCWIFFFGKHKNLQKHLKKPRNENSKVNTLTVKGSWIAE